MKSGNKIKSLQELKGFSCFTNVVLPTCLAPVSVITEIAPLSIISVAILTE